MTAPARPRPSGVSQAGGPAPLLRPVALDRSHGVRGRNRSAEPRPDVVETVSRILAAVRTDGDAALRDLARRFDGVEPEALEVPREACDRALAKLDSSVRSALNTAAANITAFHRAQIPPPLEVETTPGVRLGRRAEPLRRVGVYAPGGRAAYPSSVLMGAIPARVAGVEDVILCSPPGPDGLPSDLVLAACAIAGVDRVFAIGGAGAIAALAYGTASVPAVDKIVGPGNAYVAEAKRQVDRVVAIDSPAGPSEILILADETADAILVAAELAAQAEHDPDAVAIVVSTDAPLLERVAAELDTLLRSQPRADIIRAALSTNGALLHARSMEESIAFAVDCAPEHLLVLTRDPRALLPSLRAAGTIFLGAPSSVAFGDYMTGANHVLPTGGLARTLAGLSTDDFLRWTTWQELTPTAAASLAAPTAALAEAEGLPAHALAARLRSAPVPATERPLALRPAYRDLSPYDPGRSPCAIDLSDNTSLFGTAPSVRRVLAELSDDDITRYPSVYADELRSALARLHGVEPENVATGCGSDDVIDSALRAFGEPGDGVAYPVPTFGMVPLFARMNTLRPQPVRPSGDVQLDADALLRTRARIVYLCRPNNPTGTVLDAGVVERICREAAGIVLIDEAYADFADDDVVRPALQSGRALVLRTLSKAYGLAGLRVGYAIGDARLIAEVEKSRGPYKVNRIAGIAAVAVLRHDRDWVDANVAEVRRNRDRLAAELRRRGVRVADSAANFLLLRIPGSARVWDRRLRRHGVAVRPFERLDEEGDALRVSVGPWPTMQRFLEAFDDVLATMTGE